MEQTTFPTHQLRGVCIEAEVVWTHRLSSFERASQARPGGTLSPHTGDPVVATWKVLANRGQSSTELLFREG